MLDNTREDSVSVHLGTQILGSERFENSSKPVPCIGDNIVVPTYLKTERKEKKEIKLLKVKVSRLEEMNAIQGDKLVAAWEEIKTLKFKLFDEQGAKIRLQQGAEQIERNQENLRSSLISFLGLDGISLE